ncbi:hypothetical protein FOA52_002426 [Chlamydomonas sp. UWO 241]|nr:hypothetical protein FOA52_002426 [Chlamydomonas sp. UWO 241]
MEALRSSCVGLGAAAQQHRAPSMRPCTGHGIKRHERCSGLVPHLTSSSLHMRGRDVAARTPAALLTPSSASAPKEPSPTGSTPWRTRSTGSETPSTSTSTKHKVAIFVEPSPFSHVSGMKNRFECLIKCLRDAGDEVVVYTPDANPPPEFCGAKVVSVLGFKLPFYSSPTLLLSPALSVFVLARLLVSRPSVIHASSPGLMVFAATLYAKLLRIPLVVSYHTHIPEYIPKYTWEGLVHPMWSIIRWCTRASDLTLVTSAAMKNELTKNLCRNKSIDVWMRGVDTEVFNPGFRSAEMRARMTGGHSDAPLMVYVGRLGSEKNLAAIKTIMAGLPAATGARMAFVGDGPQRSELEALYAGEPVVFMGMLKGRELSEAYASADIFVMPSETETLGFVVLEAMASGLAVVSVAAGGLTDILNKPGVTGHLYPQGEYAKAAELIAGLVADPKSRDAMATAARSEVEKFGWSAATKVLREQQYERAIRVSASKLKFRIPAVRVS